MESSLDCKSSHFLLVSGAENGVIEKKVMIFGIATRIDLLTFITTKGKYD